MFIFVCRGTKWRGSGHLRCKQEGEARGTAWDNSPCDTHSLLGLFPAVSFCYMWHPDWEHVKQQLMLSVGQPPLCHAHGGTCQHWWHASLGGDIDPIPARAEKGAREQGDGFPFIWLHCHKQWQGYSISYQTNFSLIFKSERGKAKFCKKLLWGAMKSLTGWMSAVIYFLSLFPFLKEMGKCLFCSMKMMFPLR